MKHGFSWFVALRYVRPLQQRGLSRFLLLASLLGLVVGVSSLIIVVSVMNGFEVELRKRLLSLIPHAQLESADRVQNWESTVAQLEQAQGIDGVAPYIEQTVLIAAGGRYLPVKIVGIDWQREQHVSVLPERIIAGSLEALSRERYGIVIGRLLAEQLRVIPGDSVHMVLPQVYMTLLGPMTREKRFTVAGIFEVGAQLDRDLAMINLPTAAKLVVSGEGVDGLRLRVNDMFAAGDIARSALQQVIEDASSFRVLDWRESQGSLFSAVVMERTLVFLMLLAVVAVACFNIVSILLMSVTEKRADIAVLRTMGATRVQIRNIFVLQGLTIGVLGTFIGGVLGMLMAPNVGVILQKIEKLSGWQLFDPNVYFIAYLPSELRLQDVMIVSVCAIVLSFLATWVPARRASLIEPAAALADEY